MQRIEHVLGVDVHYFAANTLWAVGRNLVWAVPGLFLGAILARTFSPKDIGTYDLIITIVSFFAIAALPGLRELVTQAAVRAYDGALKQATTVAFFGMILVTPILFAVALWYWMRGDVMMGAGLVIFGTLSIFSTPFRFYDAFLYGKKRFDLVTRYEALASILSALVLGGAMWIGKSILILLAFRGALEAVFSLLFYQKAARLRTNEKTVPGQVRYGTFLTLNSLIPLLAARLDKILLASFFSPAELGIYFFSTIIPASLQRYWKTLIDVAFPKIAVKSRNTHRTIIQTHLWKLIIGSIALSLLLFFVVPFMIPLLFTETYQSAILYAQLESLSFSLFPVNLFLASFLTAERRKRSQLTTSIIPALAKIVLAFLLIPSFGIFAVIGVNAASRVLTLLLTLDALFLRKD